MTTVIHLGHDIAPTLTPQAVASNKKLVIGPRAGHPNVTTHFFCSRAAKLPIDHVRHSPSALAADRAMLWPHQHAAFSARRW
jgi:hypothetical protein